MRLQTAQGYQGYLLRILKGRRVRSQSRFDSCLLTNLAKMVVLIFGQQLLLSLPPKKKTENGDREGKTLNQCDRNHLKPAER